MASDDTNDDTEKASVEVVEVNNEVDMSGSMPAPANSSSTVEIGKRSFGDVQVPVSVMVAVPVFKALSSVFTSCTNKKRIRLQLVTCQHAAPCFRCGVANHAALLQASHANHAASHAELLAVQCPATAQKCCVGL